MSFLDRFKRKAKPDDDTAPQPDSGSPAAESASVPPKPQPAKPLASKTLPTKLTMPPKVVPASDEVRLELGDFLHRIPAQLLLPGPHDLKTELRFEIAVLSQQIAQGNTMVNLAEVYRRIPQIFRAEVVESDNVEIRFPWQKIAKLVAAPKSEAGLDGNAAVSPLAERLKVKKPPVKPAGQQPGSTSRVCPDVAVRSRDPGSRAPARSGLRSPQQRLPSECLFPKPHVPRRRRSGLRRRPHRPRKCRRSRRSRRRHPPHRVRMSRFPIFPPMCSAALR